MPDTTAWPEHITWIARNRGPALLARLAHERVGLDAEQALAVLVAADPSPGLHAVQWLCDSYLARGFRWEDIASGARSRAAQTLGLFAQYRGQLARGLRNLEDHKTLADLYCAIQPHLEPVSAPEVGGGRALKRSQRMLAREQSIMVCERPDLIVAVPTTRWAAQWWGRGTRWCTAADEDNMFEHYNESAPLIVVVLPGIPCNKTLQGGKLQMCIDDGEVQFMDAADDDVEPEFVAQHWRRLEGLMTWAVGQCCDAIRYIPEDKQTHEICLRAVQRDGSALNLLAEHLLDERIYRAALETYSGAIEYMPDSMLDHEVCTKAVEDSAYNIQHVPQRLRTEAMCLTAVRSSGSTLQYIESPSAEVCLAAVRDNGHALRSVPHALRTREVCLAAVMCSPSTIDMVPRAYRDHDFHAALLAVSGDSLQHIPPRLRTRELCLLAVADTGAALPHVPRELRDERMYWTALRAHRNGGNMALCLGGPLRHVPRHSRTHAMCLASVQANGYALRHVPRMWVDAAMCDAAVKTTPGAFRDVPPRLQTLEMALQAVVSRDYESCLVYMTTRLRTPQVLAASIHAWPMALAFMRTGEYNLELCLLAVRANRCAYPYVPDYLQDAVDAALALPCKASARGWDPDVALAGLAAALGVNSPLDSQSADLPAAAAMSLKSGQTQIGG